jgi:hypothetical protein
LRIVVDETSVQVAPPSTDRKSSPFAEFRIA